MKPLLPSLMLMLLTAADAQGGQPPQTQPAQQGQPAQQHTAQAQQPQLPQQPMVLLDPARGGSESGARIEDRVQEKEVTLQTAMRLARLLRARGFAVAMTRENDTDVSNDTRAALANTSKPMACILLHASAAGTGVHLWTTSLKQPATVDPSAPVAWDEAQAAFADRSRAMAELLADALGRSRLPVSSGATWIRPLDNMQCPAVAVEMGPLNDGTHADDPPYQNKVTDAIAGAMLPWRDRVGSMTPPAPPKPVVAAPSGTGASAVPQPRASAVGTEQP